MIFYYTVNKINPIDVNKQRLSEAVEQLSAENQNRLLGALEALYFAQSQRYANGLETEAAQERG